MPLPPPYSRIGAPAPAPLPPRLSCFILTRIVESQEKTSGSGLFSTGFKMQISGKDSRWLFCLNPEGMERFLSLSTPIDTFRDSNAKIYFFLSLPLLVLFQLMSPYPANSRHECTYRVGDRFLFLLFHSSVLYEREKICFWIKLSERDTDTEWFSRE